MSSAKTPDDIDVLGLDLGHGESALAHSLGKDYKENKKNPPFIIGKSEITAIAYLKSGEAILGASAIQGEEVEEFDVSFKSKPGLSSRIDKLMANFAYGYIQYAFTEVTQLNEESTEVFIGCPSGWDAKTRDDYCKLFIESKINNVNIIRESEAAYAYYFGVLKGSAEYKDEISLGELDKLPLILDFGSSTLDVTLEKRVGEPITEGIFLGSGLIDEAIIAYNLKHCLDENYPVSRGMRIDFEDTIEDLQTTLKTNRSVYSRALLEARLAKQLYWNTRKNVPEGTKLKPIKPMPELIPGMTLPLYVDDDLMNLILTSPLKDVLPDHFELPLDEKLGDFGRYSWLECCQKFLEIKFKNKLSEQDLSFTDVGVIVLTGGASLMTPVRTIIRNFFSDIEQRLIRYDTEPSLCIAKGLAARGRMELITRDFEKEVLDFCGDTENGLYKIIGDQFGEKLYINLLTLLGDKFGELTYSECKRWQEGYIESSQIGFNIRDKLRKWSNSNELEEKIKKELRASEIVICEKINNRLMPILKKYFDQEIGFLSTISPVFLTKTFAEIFYEYSEEFGVEIDFDYSSKASLITNLQSIAQLFSEALDDNPSNLNSNFSSLKDISTGFGGRWWQMDESKMKALSNIFKKINYDLIIKILKSEDFVNKVIYPTQLAMLTALRKKINQEKYVLYALS